MTSFDPSEPIAIVGLGGVFPGSADVPTFWRNILGKVDSIIEVPKDRWDWRLYYDANPAAPDKTYSKIGGFVRDFHFDPLKLRIPPPVAQQMDMVQKMAVAATGEALADSGYDKKPYDSQRTAVILGNSMGGTKKESTDLRVYTALYQSRLLSAPAFAKLPQATRDAILKETETGIKSQLSTITEDTMPGELSNVIAGRVANVFNFNGANFTVDAACASSLAALDQAVHGLRFHEYDMVICGGVDQMMSPPAFVKFCKIGALSPDGSRPFDAGANGFVMGEGVGVCVLKRLSHALADGDKIYALIRAIGSSSDGRGKGITAPNPKGQKLAIERAFDLLDYKPDGVGLLEAHGTSTKVGDAVELSTATEFFRPYCQPGTIGLGSVKSQIGHLKAAAGVAGLVKAALAIRHKTLPPSINFKTPNPGIDWKNCPFFVVTEAREWATHGKPMRAHLSSFGFGGTNFHVALEEASPVTIERWKKGRPGSAFASQAIAPTPLPAVLNAAATAKETGEAFFIHGASPDAIFDRLSALKEKASRGGTPLAALAYDVNTHKRSGEYSLCFAAESESKLIEKIDIVLKIKSPELWEHTPPAFRPKGIFLGRKKKHGKVAFLFPGQGSQYVDMLKDLRDKYPIVAQTFAEADEVMSPLIDGKLSDVIFSRGDETPEQIAAMEDRLKQTETTQPAVLTSDVALFRLLQSFGVQPDMVCGHSLGEYGALVAAGVLPFKDALLAVSARGKEMAGVRVADAGKMASVAAPLEKVEPVLKEIHGYVAAANKNCPSQTVIAGETKAVEAAIKKFGSLGIQSQEIRVSHAFHSKIVEPAQAPYRRFLERMPLQKPMIPILSNVTAAYYPDDIADIRELLVAQIASPVEFIRQIERMRKDGATLFVEVGPKRVLTAFVTSIFEGKKDVVALSSNHPKKGGLNEFNELLARLEAEGVTLRIEDKRPPVAAPKIAETAPALPVTKLDSKIADQWGFYTGPVVVSGIAAGVPGTWDRVFREGGIDSIIGGQNLIELLPEEEQRKQLDKNLDRVMKSETGAHAIERLESIEQVMRLAGRAGAFDIAEEFGVRASVSSLMDMTAKLSLAAALLALKDAGIPLVHHYKKTTTGGMIPTSWGLPDSLQEETGVILGTAFPGLDSFVEDLTRYFKAKYSGKSRRAMWEMYDRLVRSIPDAAERKALADWYEEQRSSLDGRDETAEYRFSRSFLFRVLALGHAQAAQFIKAKGPCTQVNAACASTTQAIAIAEDWIRVGRAKRVIVMGSDNITNPTLLEWLGTGFLASGATSTHNVVSEAALPFDRRRNGMIPGMGAVALVVEGEQEVARRGMKPLAELLASQFDNSAYHVTRLNTQHVSETMERLVRKAEVRHGLSRKNFAAKTLFMSHETYTPAQGGSSSAEVTALKHVFGPDTDKVVVTNTKGFTGHAMGASIEDVIAVRAMNLGKLPPIANYKEPDPDLAGISLSRGGSYDCEYALRLAAGFGSQIAMTLMRRTWKASEPRVYEPQRHRDWLRAISGEENPDLEVVQNTLRIKDLGRRKISAASPTPVIANGAASANGKSPARTNGTSSNGKTPAVPVAPAASGAPSAKASVDEKAVMKEVVALVSEKTGYPAEMLELDLDMEADLGIDTVKQAELFGIVRDRYGIPRKENLSLKEYPTLRHVIRFVLESNGGSSSASAEAAPTLEPALATAAVSSPAVHAAGSAGAERLMVPTAPQRQGELHAVENALAEALRAPAPIEPGKARTERGALNEEQVRSTILQLVSEKTGYPVEMLELDLDMEADLGIDTVKQAELFGMVRERYGIPRKENLSLKEYPTLRHVIGFVLDSGPAGGSVAAETAVEETRPAPSVEFGRWVLDWRDAPLAVKGTFVLSKDKPVLVLSKSPATAKPFADALKKLGVACIAQSLSDWKDSSSAPKTKDCQGILYLGGIETSSFKTPASAAFDAEYRSLVRPLFLAAKALRQTLNEKGGWILAPTQAETSPLAGAVTGLAKALTKELDRARVVAVDIDAKSTLEKIVSLSLSELVSGDAITEVRYRAGKRQTPWLRPEELPAKASAELSEKSTALVTGGGQGLGGECAKGLAKRYQCALLVLGRTPLDPNAKEWAALDETGLKALKDRLWEKLKSDKSKKATPVLLEREFSKITKAIVLYRNLEAMRSAGSRVDYIAVDLADGAAVAKALKGKAKPDIVLHAAGLEESKLLADKTLEGFDAVFMAKAHGAVHLLKAVPAKPRQRWVLFSSVVGRFGNLGQTDYAAASEFLAQLAPSLRRAKLEAVTIDLTAFSEIGMATRGGVEQFLKSQGVDFMPPAVGVAMILDEASRNRGDVEVLLAGSLGKLDVHHQIAARKHASAPAKTAAAANGVSDAHAKAEVRTSAPSPAARHSLSANARLLTESELKKDPAVGIVTAKEFTLEKDPWLNDHSISGTPYVAGVMGLELFAEAVAKLTGTLPTAFADVRFDLPIKLLRGKPVTVRTAYETAGNAGPRLHIESDFFTPQGIKLGGPRTHFKARPVDEGVAERVAAVHRPSGGFAASAESIYSAYFHGPSFQVLEGIASLTESEALAVLKRPQKALWTKDKDLLFHPMLIEAAFQACGYRDLHFAKRMTLPDSIDRVRVRAGEQHDWKGLFVSLRYKGEAEGKSVYDAQVIDERGRVWVELEGYKMVPVS